MLHRPSSERPLQQDLTKLKKYWQGGGSVGGDGGLADADAAVVGRDSARARARRDRRRELGLDDLGEAGVLEHAAGEGDRVEARVRREPAAGEPAAAPAERLVEPGGEHRRRGARARARRSHGATSGAGSSTEHSASTRRPGVAGRLGAVTVRASASSSIAACAS